MDWMDGMDEDSLVAHLRPPLSIWSITSIAAMCAVAALAAAPPACAQAPAGPTIDGNTGLPIPCRCRYAGRTYELGETVCLALPEGRKRARCARVDNVTSWTVISEGCDVSSGTNGDGSIFQTVHSMIHERHTENGTVSIFHSAAICPSARSRSTLLSSS